MLDKKQKEWVGNVSKTLGIAEKDEQTDAKQQYAETLKLLTPRFKNALSHDKDGVLGGKINTAVKFAQSGSYIDAQNTLDDAGQYATQLMSSNMETHEGSGELIGKALPGKYKNEQFQKDEEGNVMHGGEFRANSKNRTNYYTDEEREKSIVRTDDQGRLVDSEGKFLPKDRGFVVSKDEGTLHSFDVNEQKTKDGYTVFTHHSSPIQGGSAAAAGEMMTEDGVVRKVTDQSGHYRPTPEMTHQFVERLQDQGVAMREQKLTMTGKDGEPEDATSEIEELWNEVNDYEKERQGTDPSAPYDKEMLAKKQKLQDLGVGMSNREATVDLTNPKTFVTSDEFEKVKGDFKAVVELVKQKVGVQPNVQFFKGDANSLEQVNDWIGVLSRVQAITPNEKVVDTKKTRLQMTTEQFAQTGGNVDAIRGKEGVNADIEKLRTPDESPEKEQERLTKMIEKLGGDAKLITLGVKDPSTLTVEQKFVVLSKGRVPENLLGGEPEPSIVLDESLSEEEMRERLMKLPPKPPRNMDEVEDPFADYEDEDDEKEESRDSEDEDVEAKTGEENLSDEEVLERLMKSPPKPPRNMDEVEDPFADSDDEDEENEEEKDEKQEKVEAKTGGETRNKYFVESGPGGYDPLAEEMKSNSPNDLKEDSSSEEEEHEEVGTETGGKPNKYLQESGPGGYDPLAEEKSDKPSDQKEEDSLKEEEHEEGGTESGGNPNKYLQESGPGGYDPLAEEKSDKPSDQKEEDSLKEEEHEEVGTETGGNPNKYLQESGGGGYDPLAEGKSYKPSDQKEEFSSEEGEDEENPSSRPPKEKYSKVELGEGEKESVDPFADDEDEEEEEEHEFPVAQQTGTQQSVAKNVKDLNLKSQKPVGTPHPRQLEFDQLGGDQALLDKLLPPWKSRNQPVLNKLLDLNKRLKTAVGTDKEQLATAIKTLTTEIDNRDRMPTLNSLAKMPIEEKIDQLKN